MISLKPIHLCYTLEVQGLSQLSSRIFLALSTRVGQLHRTLPLARPSRVFTPDTLDTRISDCRSVIDTACVAYIICHLHAA
jgi:hypothetical protein